MSARPQLTAEEVEKIIKRHNEELPKDPNANPDDLILGDNEVSTTVRLHLGTLTAMVGYGSLGSGKTWTCYKVFHDLKRKARVTYVPLRSYRESGRAKLTLNSRGVASLVATAIAEALVKPRSLSTEVPGALTNVSADIDDFRVDRKLEEVLEDYVKVLREKQEYHVVLLDEFDKGIESIDDIEALVDYIVASRHLLDKYGVVRVTLVALMAPVPSSGLRATYENKPAYEVFSEVFKSRYPSELIEPYMALVSTGVNLNQFRNVASMLRDFAKKSVDIVKKNLGININIRDVDVDKAVRLLAGLWPSMRWGKDILVKALAEAIASGFQASLLEYVERSLKDVLGLSSPTDVKKIFVEDRWGYVGEYSTQIAREFAERVLKEACKTLGCTVQPSSERREPGFISVSERVWKIDRRGEISRDIVFWFRLSDITDPKTIGKAQKIFGDSYIVIVAPEGTKINVAPRKMLGVIRLPRPLFYYVLTAEVKYFDNRFEDYCRKLIGEEIEKHSSWLSELLKNLLV